MAEGDFQTVSIYDPAIDHETTSEEAFTSFFKDTRDISLLKTRPGMHLTVYTLREIPSDIFDAYVGVQATESLRFAAAFRAALIRVEYGVHGTTGKPLPHPWVPAKVYGGQVPADQFALLTNEEAKLFDRPTVQEIGGVAYSRSDFCLRGKVVRWLLPPLSLRIWEAVRSRFLAEREATSAAASGTSSQTPASPQPEPTTSVTEISASPSAVPGDAPATEPHT